VWGCGEARSPVGIKGHGEGRVEHRPRTARSRMRQPTRRAPRARRTAETGMWTPSNRLVRRRRCAAAGEEVDLRRRGPETKFAAKHRPSVREKAR
jgi:hypothetical protein